MITSGKTTEVGTGIWDAARFEIDVEWWFSIFAFLFVCFRTLSYFEKLSKISKAPFVYMGSIYE